jgi:chaperonin GroES
MNVQPLRDFVVVVKDEAPQKTEGGLFIPGNVDGKIANATIIAVGSGRVTLDGTVVPMEVKVGDKVAFNVNLGTEVKVDGQTAYCLREDQLLYIIK